MPAFSPAARYSARRQAWEAVLAVNLWGVINGSRVFASRMTAHGQPGVIINTGSKQGITTPPGDPAYNVSKAGVKAFTEALEHELRNIAGGQVHAHLLIPGFVYTSLTASGRTEKPEGAWTPDQTVDFMMESLERGDFYILCPDNDVIRVDRRETYPVGSRRHRREPAAAVALAPGLCRRLQGLPRQGAELTCSAYAEHSVLRRGSGASDPHVVCERIISGDEK